MIQDPVSHLTQSKFVDQSNMIKNNFAGDSAIGGTQIGREPYSVIDGRSQSYIYKDKPAMKQALKLHEIEMKYSTDRGEVDKNQTDKFTLDQANNSFLDNLGDLKVKGSQSHR